MLLIVKKIFKSSLLLFTVFFINAYAENTKSINPIDKTRWLEIYYKESTEEYNYFYDVKQRYLLKDYSYKYFLESSLISWVSDSKIKKENFKLLKDSSIELRPANNIIFRVIINPYNKTISEIMVNIDTINKVDNFDLFYNLSLIAIGMINIDITKYDIDSIYNKISIIKTRIDKNYSAGLIKDGIDYSVFYVDDSIIFILKKTKIEVIAEFSETGEEKNLAEFKDKAANNDEFFDTSNRDPSK